jgi:hypothetical protein
LAPERREEQLSQAAEELGFILPPKFVFPHADHRPAFGAEEAVDAEVAGLVGGDLLPPEGGVGLGLGRVPGAAVPEAAVHKHRGLEFGENEVGLAGQLSLPHLRNELLGST